MVDINEGNVYVLVFNDGDSLDVSKIIPGWKGTKTFSIKNSTDTAQIFSMKWISVTNTFTTTNNLYYSIKRNNTSIYNNLRTPYSETTIMSNITIPSKTTYAYSFNFEFKETNISQDMDRGKVFDAKIKIIVSQ